MLFVKPKMTFFRSALFSFTSYMFINVFLCYLWANFDYTLYVASLNITKIFLQFKNLRDNFIPETPEIKHRS